MMNFSPLKLVFLAVVGILLVVSSVVDVVRAEDEPSECEVGTELIHESANYSTVRDLVEMDLVSIMSNNITTGTDNCVYAGGYIQCFGSVNATTLTMMTNVCTALNGTLVTMSNVRITCTPTERNRTYTVVETIYDCISPVCDEDELETHVKDNLKDLSKVAGSLLVENGTCKGKEGGDYDDTPIGSGGAAWFALSSVGTVVTVASLVLSMIL